MLGVLGLMCARTCVVAGLTRAFASTSARDSHLDIIVWLFVWDSGVIYRQRGNIWWESDVLSNACRCRRVGRWGVGGVGHLHAEGVTFFEREVFLGLALQWGVAIAWNSRTVQRGSCDSAEQSSSAAKQRPCVSASVHHHAITPTSTPTTAQDAWPSVAITIKRMHGVYIYNDLSYTVDRVL